jgi:hypothetical protein
MPLDARVPSAPACPRSLDAEGGVTARLLTRQHCGLHPDEAARISEGYAGRVRILPQDG